MSVSRMCDGAVVVGFPYNKVVTKTLYLLVLDYDRFSRDDPIGEVCLPLSELDLGAGLTLWKTLMPCKGAAVCSCLFRAGTD